MRKRLKSEKDLSSPIYSAYCDWFLDIEICFPEGLAFLYVFCCIFPVVWFGLVPPSKLTFLSSGFKHLLLAISVVYKISNFN